MVVDARKHQLSRSTVRFSLKNGVLYPIKAFRRKVMKQQLNCVTRQQNLSLILIFSISLCYNAGHLSQRTCNVGKDCRREVPGRSFKQNG